MGQTIYITKPFSHVELMVRAHAVLRRSEGIVTAEESPFVSGKLLVNFATNEVMLDGKPVKLASTESKLLYHLIKDEGRLLPHENLLQKVWGENTLMPEIC